jgi:hypothetical protein
LKVLIVFKGKLDCLASNTDRLLKVFDLPCTFKPLLKRNS